MPSKKIFQNAQPNGGFFMVISCLNTATKTMDGDSEGSKNQDRLLHQNLEMKSLTH